MRPLFQLDPRLLLCASFVPQGARLADIGTDHGYLPIWLAKTGRIPRGIAADLRPGPLERAKENVSKYRVEALVELRLSDGLQAISPGETDIIVIAGMGGEVIASILDAAPWIKEEKTGLILQPMTRAEELRRYLAENGFEILKERPVLSQGRPYSALLAAFTGRRQDRDILYPYIGKLLQSPLTGETERAAALAYLEKQLRHLRNLYQGTRARREPAEESLYGQAVKALETMLREEFESGHDL